MFVLAKRNIIIPSTEPGIQPVALKKDGFADVPEWAEYSPYVTELNNDMEYASYVNDGHRMDKHFVPGLYLNETSGLLEYDPGKRGEAGMMVGTKTKYVEGLHMTDAATEAYKQTVKTEADALCRRIEEALK